MKMMMNVHIMYKNDFAEQKTSNGLSGSVEK
jgi:hypothetical protein